MAQQAPPVPDINNVTNAMQGMAQETNTISQSMGAYHTHTQSLVTELSLIGNYQAPNIANQLQILTAMVTDLRTNMNDRMTMMDARQKNSGLFMRNMNVRDSRAALQAFSVCDSRPQAVPLLNTPIHNFPTSPAQIEDLSAVDLRRILQDLDRPVPANTSRIVLRLTLRETIGLPAY